MIKVIQNAVILTMDENFTSFSSGYVAVKDDRIIAAGEGRYPGNDGEALPADGAVCRNACGGIAESSGRNVSSEETEFIDGHGGILIPGFVNTHCHASMIPFRSMGDDCRDRLQRFLFPLENEAMTPDLVYHAARYGIMEMLLSGITTFADMYYFEDQVARAAQELGIRAYVGETVIGMPTCDSPEPYGGLQYAERLIRDWKGTPHIHPFVAPHATNTCTGEMLQKAYALAKRENTLFSLHNAEMDYEMTYFRDTFNTTPTAYLHSLGVLGSRTLLAHCIHLSDQDLEILRAADAAVAHCIGANTKSGKGVARLKDLHEMKIRTGLGTDGPSSGNTLDLFVQMRLAASFHKTSNHDRALFPSEQLLRFATAGGAEALGGAARYGTIAPGRKADLTLISMDAVHMFPCFDPYAVLVYSANASDVSMVMSDGNILVRDGHLLNADFYREREILRELMQPFYKKAAAYRNILREDKK